MSADMTNAELDERIWGMKPAWYRSVYSCHATLV
jgi:hypothetical protein